MDNLHKWTCDYWNKVENNVAKGEIARFEQFLLLQHCFQNSSATEAQKASVCGKGLTLNWDWNNARKSYNDDKPNVN